MSLTQELEHKIKLVNTYLKKYMQRAAASPPPVCEAMEYSLFAGGKRIRPVLMMSAYELFESDCIPVMPFACALEMIHAYSLIHDDLPAMDNSPLRRGLPTSHMVYGEAMAVLAGDALLNFAFEVCLETAETDASRTLKALACIANASGVHGMIGGQVIDISSEGQKLVYDQLKILHAKKTGALICAAVLSGAILGGADAVQLESLKAFAQNFGLAFQIKDDILDVEGDSATLGKPTGNDAQGLKNTYVSLLGLEKSKYLLSEYTKKAQDNLSMFGEKAKFLLELTQFLAAREK